ncbi:MAG: class I SAM-dependent methyltransferase [Candidatus Rokubacteria bacterium]|nr:class I SAM-dependent methyltransferase [Candidatus Rokubacteria bacterium]
MSPGPSPELFFTTITAYQRTAALVGALELDLFTAIGEGRTSVPALAERVRASQRGVRILCDYLTTAGFLTKSGGGYALTPDTATFLDRRSPAYLGDAASFIASPHLYEGFRDVAAAVRRDGTAMAAGGTVAPDHPVWGDFARVMLPSARPAADAMATALAVDGARPVRVLDVAAGHGAFGIALARRHANVDVTALDWPRALDAARANAQRAALGSRYRTIAGDAFDVDWGTGYDVVLLANFLHHWSVGECERLARKARAVLVAGGRAVTVEFVPNDDRVTPPAAASFALVMLCTTPDGDAYTFAEYDRIFRTAGFASSEMVPLPPTMQQLIVSST